MFIPLECLDIYRSKLRGTSKKPTGRAIGKCSHIHTIHSVPACLFRILNQHLLSSTTSSWAQNFRVYSWVCFLLLHVHYWWGKIIGPQNQSRNTNTTGLTRPPWFFWSWRATLTYPAKPINPFLVST